MAMMTIGRLIAITPGTEKAIAGTAITGRVHSVVCTLVSRQRDGYPSADDSQTDWRDTRTPDESAKQITSHRRPGHGDVTDRGRNHAQDVVESPHKALRWLLR